VSHFTVRVDAVRLSRQAFSNPIPRQLRAASETRCENAAGARTSSVHDESTSTSGDRGRQSAAATAALPLVRWQGAQVSVEGAGGPSWYTEYNVLSGLHRALRRFQFFVTRIAAGRVERGLPALQRCGYRTTQFIGNAASSRQLLLKASHRRLR